jgi:hypothetical protein
MNKQDKTTSTQAEQAYTDISTRQLTDLLEVSALDYRRVKALEKTYLTQGLSCFVTLKQACAMLPYNSQYVRQLVLQGKIEGIKTQGIWYLYKPSIIAYQKQRENRLLQRYDLYVKPEDMAVLEQAIKDLNITYRIKKGYTSNE